jgi:hypothetical protein
MRAKLTKRAVFAVGLLLVGVLIVFSLFAPPKEDRPLVFQILSVETGASAERTLLFSMLNTSRDTIQYRCADGTNFQPRCEFVLKTNSGETNWTSAPSKSSRFLSPGAKITINLPIPAEGDLRLGILARRLPHTH